MRISRCLLVVTALLLSGSAFAEDCFCQGGSAWSVARAHRNRRATADCANCTNATCTNGNCAKATAAPASAPVAASKSAAVCKDGQCATGTCATGTCSSGSCSSSRGERSGVLGIFNGRSHRSRGCSKCG